MNSKTKRVVSLFTAFAVAGLSSAHAGSCGDHAYLKLQMDPFETAGGAGILEKLVADVKAAGLVETLKGEGPFTVFAPTDEAFAVLPAGALESLLKTEQKNQLVAILTYRVDPAEGMTVDVRNREAPTVNGQTASVVVSFAGVTI
jgi:uncharacterized surface protein with fasciclin (FAS1) repeats